MQKGFNLVRVNSVMFLVYESATLDHFPSANAVVQASPYRSNLTVALGAQEMYVFAGNQTSGAGKVAISPHGCQRGAGERVSWSPRMSRLKWYLPLRIIGSVCQDPGENPSSDAIEAVDDHSMAITSNKLRVE